MNHLTKKKMAAQEYHALAAKADLKIGPEKSPQRKKAAQICPPETPPARIKAGDDIQGSPIFDNEHRI
ncbi:MAG: hypothetical protein ACR2OA_19875 [Rubripirellula sp.]|jgi:hypothetical protein